MRCLIIIRAWIVQTLTAWVVGPGSTVVRDRASAVAAGYQRGLLVPG